MADSEDSSKGSTTTSLRNAWGNVLAFFILLLIGVLAFSIRLFSVIKYESVIHEFDPYFNYRVTQYLTKNGIYDFWNWFDDRTWYPLGRVIGGTVYPGLTLTAGSIWRIVNSLNIPLSVETVCVFTAPIFSANAAWATYLLTKEVKGVGAGLTAAALLGMVPSYISRSVAGSYDNEAVAIFALIFTFYLYVKTLNTGSLFYATLNALAYFYMVCSWGGYTFIINLIPMHVLLCIVTGRYSSRLYIAYAPLVVLGTLLAALVPVVGFNAVMTSEHFASFLVFIVINVVALVHYIKGILSPKMFKVAMTLVVTFGMAICCAVIAVLVALVASSPTKGWSGRSLSLLDPTYASKYIPIIASVSEHQPPTWPSYFMDINVLAFLVPAGIIACFLPLSDASSFMVLYIVTSVYFSGVMVRLMLVLAPAACIMSGIALSEAFDVFTRSVKFQLSGLLDRASGAGDITSGSVAPQNDGLKADKQSTSDKPEDSIKERPSRKNKKKEKENVEKVPVKSKAEKRLLVLPLETSAIAILLLVIMGAFYVVHCVWAAAEAYSAPSIVLTSYSNDGLHVFDDFREAYAWLRHNTDVDDKVASWWDYGYQTTAMANRTVIVAEAEAASSKPQNNLKEERKKERQKSTSLQFISPMAVAISTLHSPLSSPTSSNPSLSPKIKTHSPKILAMAPKKKVNKYDNTWKKQWFGAGIFFEGSEEVNVDVFKKLEKKRVLSNVEKAGLLSKAEEFGLTLSSIEKLGFFSKAEELGLLSLLERTASFSPSVLASVSLPLFVAAIAAVVLIPDDSAALVALKAALAAAFGIGAAGLIVGSVVLDGLQESD